MNFLFAWLGAGALLAPLSYGLTFGYFQRRFPGLAGRDYYGDRSFAAHFGLMTFFLPLLILVPFFCSDFGRYGLKFR